MRTNVHTTPDLLRHDGTTAGIITGPDGITLDVVSIPADEDRGRWGAGADLALRGAGWARVGAWGYDGAELVAEVSRLVTVRLRNGGPVTRVVDVEGAVRDEYGQGARLMGGHDVGGMCEYDVVTPTGEPNTWNRLGSAFLYD